MDLNCLFVLSTLVVIGSHGLPKLLFTNRFNICSVDVGGGGHGGSELVISGLKDAAALDFLYEDQVVYWTDVSQERVKSARLDGSPSVVDVVATGLVSPDGLACDWVTRKLYWVDSETNRIEASNLDGSMRKILFWRDLDQPRAVALDPVHGYFYWTDWGETAKIERAAMDGNPASREVIVSTNISRPNGLTIDYDEARIYWTDARLRYIHSANLDGSDRLAIVTESMLHSFSIPFAVTVFGSGMYWTDWHTRTIYACNKSDANNSMRSITDRLYLPMGVHVFNAQRQPKSRNPCGEMNGGCSHLCFLSPWFPFYSCQCPTGIRLLDDNTTCDRGPSEMLLLARRTDIRLISLDTPDFLDVVLEISDVRNAIAVDYDPVERMVYWTDDDLHVIRRASINGSVVETFVDIEVYHPDGIAVDWLSRNLYWTDTGSDLIQVAKLTDFTRKVIISEGLDEPRAIVVDPLKGYMYWSDWGKNSKIERSGLDGSDRTVLVSDDLGWPNGLTVDHAEDKLYWADAKLDVIKYIHLNGSVHRILVAEHIPHIFGFALLGDYVYWTDWQRRAIERVNKTSGKQRTVVVDQLPDIMGLAAVSTNFIPVKKGCAVENGGCSHLCLMTPSGPVCACPFAMELRKPERKTCVHPEALILYTKQSEVHVVSLENVDNDVIVPLRELKSVSDVDFDFATNHIYWADTNKKMISRAFLNGSMIQSVIHYGLESPDSVAVDWLSRNIYWTDFILGRIEMARFDGTWRRVVIWKDIKPRALALDPDYGFMYWVNTMNPSGLEWATLDGMQRRLIVPELDHVTSVAVDYEERRLYWINPATRRIESSATDGTDRRVVIGGLQQSYSLTLYDDFVYWTDQKAGGIRRACRDDGLNQSLVLGEIMSPMDVEIFHSSRQSGWSSCSHQNGGCAHLCVTDPRTAEATAHSHHCICSTHFTLASDRSSCLPPDLLVLLSQRNSISQLSINPSSAATDSLDIPLALPPHLLGGIKAFDFNFVDEHIYWVNSKTRTIRKIKLDGSNMGILLQNTGNSGSVAPFDVVVDSVENLVYWSDSVRNVIGVMRSDGSEVGVIVNDTQQRPRNLALAQETSLIFWTNLAASSQTISCSEIDGSGLRTVFSGEMGLLGPIVADSQTKRIFWVDLHRHVIESGSFNGSNRRVVLELESASQPVGLAVHGEFLYWADRESKFLARANKNSGQNRQVLKSKLSHLNDLVLVDDRNHGRPQRSRCLQKNLRCSHLCVCHEDGAARCACPVGLVLDVDGQTCVLSLPCAADQVACPSGLNPCIPLKWKCDGEDDCRDRSDEANCAACPGGFSCLTGKCISLDRHCNGQRDCPDSSDEKGCTACRRREDCANDRTCFTKSQLCDGVVNCWDGYDEMNCVVPVAKPGAGVQNSLVTIGILCGFLAVTLCISVIYLCRYRIRGCLKAHQKTGSPNLSSLPVGLKCSPLCNINSLQSSQGLKYARSNTIASDEPPDLFENLDTSTTFTSRASRYPHLTHNPPPTPVTSDASSTTNVHGSYGASSLLWIKHGCQKHRYVPPPTPCSTDVCDESEPYSADEQHRFLSNAETVLETDLLYPPPPTPCSHFLPDGRSGPPSPGPSHFCSGSYESSLNFS